MTVISCAKNMNPSLATDIKVFLLSRGVILTPNARGFVVASPTSPVASGLSSVEDPHLNRVDVHPGRFVFCSDTASTVGLTLRANGTQYAATNAVYARQVRSHALDELAFYGDKLLAFSTTDTTLSVAWTGSKISDLGKEEGFRAEFDIFTPCKSASQLLAPGMSVLLDLEVRLLLYVNPVWIIFSTCTFVECTQQNPSPPPSAEESEMILRLYPSAGTIDYEKREATIRTSGVRVADLGYRDDYFLKGFRRGWYVWLADYQLVQGFLYFRCVGDHPSRFLSGGDASNSYKFNIREAQDFGYDNMRVMIELPDEGIVYCRGVGDNHTNPEMACVLFDSEGNVRDRYAYLGKLGRWNDIVQ
ncbi:hypothetical protein JG688_00009046 [Phytophthora aleatoria]|uniref:Uncharacterized protein n=1 Tax=Phytophthora aleatoria TaxID=2496075 RepID=A0A8J5J767_9STRA|nr:hypothetical protein JG688_00009046 [Phytophthora aleatoria]